MNVQQVNKKLYPCSRCGKLVKIRSKGLCPSCRAKELSNGHNGIYGGKGQNSHSKNRKNIDPGLSDFFGSMIEKLSESKISYTGVPIYFPSACNVCHILPKRHYKSVAKEESNIIFLTLEEHTLFDNLLDRLDFESLKEKFPVVWRRALSQVREMDKEGKIKEHGKLISRIRSILSD